MRTIIIRRKEVLNHLPKEIRAGAKVKIGSLFVNRLPLKGVEGKEEEKLLKELIDVPPTHNDWPAKTKDFWSSLSITVPFEGVELNIETSEDGTPVNAIDYIKYKWAIKHRHVAMSEDEMKSTPDKRFYIYDPQKDLLKKNNKIQLKKDADKEFIKLTGEFEKMRTLLRVLSKGNPDNLTDMEVEIQLYDVKDSNPERFLKYCLDDSLELRSEIEQMIEYGVLRRIGNQIIYQDATLGENMTDTIIYFKNKKNSGAVNAMRAQLKEVK